MVSKYVDHLPLYRQEQIFKRYAIDLVRSTMDEWFGQLSWLLMPIVNAMQRRFLSGEYLQCDETPIDIQDHESRGKKKEREREEGYVGYDELFRSGRMVRVACLHLGVGNRMRPE